MYAVVDIQTHQQIMSETLQEATLIYPHIPVCVLLWPDSSQGQSVNYYDNRGDIISRTERYGSEDQGLRHGDCLTPILSMCAEGIVTHLHHCILVFI